MKRLCRLQILFMVLALSGCGRQDVSGGYIAQFSNGIYWLQLTETADGNLTGQMESLLIQDSGKLDYENAAITGAANGRSVSIAMKPLSFLPVDVSASGTSTGNRLVLTGGFGTGSPETITFARANVARYQQLASALKERSSQLVAAKEAAKAKAREEAAVARQKKAFLSEISILTQRMAHLDSIKDGWIGNVRKIEGGFRNNTSKMMSLVGRERTLARNPNASVERSQISIAVNQGSIASDQLHYRLQSFENDFGNNGKALAEHVTKAANICNAPTAAPDPDIEAACKSLLADRPSFKTNFRAMGDALTHAEGIYRREHATQQRLVNEASRME